MFSNFFFLTLKRVAVKRSYLPKGFQLDFRIRLGKKWEERKGEGNCVNYIAALTMKIGEQDRDKSIMAGKKL